MRREDIIRLAREAEFDTSDPLDKQSSVKVRHSNGSWVEISDRLNFFAELVKADFLEKSGQYITNDASREAAIRDAVLAEREECAKICNDLDDGEEGNSFGAGYDTAARGCAEFIRSRSAS